MNLAGTGRGHEGTRNTGESSESGLVPFAALRWPVLHCDPADDRHVDLAAIQSNLRAIAALLAAKPDQPREPRNPGTAGTPEPRTPEIISVVKANAYGHGAAAVGPALEAAGASMLACADIEEGVALREAGVSDSDPGVRRAQRQ